MRIIEEGLMFFNAEKGRTRRLRRGDAMHCVSTTAATNLPVKINLEERGGDK
jgi:hypothetical protein